jgi:replication-associated recombination protein RarA
MKDLDYGKNYRYAHDDPKGANAQSHLPKELEGCQYYKPQSPIPASSSSDEEEDITAPW